MNSILIITPTYNERNNISRLIPLLRESVPEAEILVVDDNSPDGTADVVKSFAQDDKKVHLLSRMKKDGLGKAYIAGMNWGLEKGYDLIVQMDADLSHSPQYLPEMIKMMASADLVLGSRYIRGGGITEWPWHRMLLSNFANRYVRLILGLKINDSTTGYRCWHRRVLEKIDLDNINSSGYAFLVEMLYRTDRQGYTIKEVPIIFCDRIDGQSKIDKKVIFESMVMPWKLRFGAPIGFPQASAAQGTEDSIADKTS